MSKEIESLVAKTSNPDALARIFEHVAERVDDLVAERRRESAERRKANGGADGR